MNIYDFLPLQSHDQIISIQVKGKVMLLGYENDQWLLYSNRLLNENITELELMELESSGIIKCIQNEVISFESIPIDCVNGVVNKKQFEQSILEIQYIGAAIVHRLLQEDWVEHMTVDSFAFRLANYFHQPKWATEMKLDFPNLESNRFFTKVKSKISQN